MPALLNSTAQVLSRPLFRLDSARHAALLKWLCFVKLGTIYTLLSVVAVLPWVMLTQVVRPITLNFDHSAASCTRMIGPWHKVTSPSSEYRVFMRPTGTFTSELCVAPQKLLSEGTVTNVPVSHSLFPVSKQLTVTTEAYPKVSARLAENSLLSIAANMIFDVDTTHSEGITYILSADNKQTDCRHQQGSISCPVRDLELEQGKSYQLVLARSLGRDTQQAFRANYTTVEPIRVVESSIANDSTVYDSPSQMVVIASKPFKPGLRAELVDSNGQKVATTVQQDPLQPTHIIISWADKLTRGMRYTFTISSMTAIDGGYLDEPYSAGFTMSVGPKVTSISVDSYGVSIAADVDITFDQALDDSQDISQIVTINGVASKILRINDRTVRIQPLDYLGRCTSYQVGVADTLRSAYGIAGSNKYSFSFRTLCQTVGSIGISVLGRSITSYSFGEGQVLLYIGATHGNEQGSSKLLYEWVDHLERNPSAIPAGRKVVIIPRINPDGYASNERTNANGKDLNRNFPANDWKASVKMPSGEVLPEGGGSAPLSEPESAALAAYVQAVRPVFTFTFHSQGGLVIGNQAGSSVTVADWYSDTVYYADETFSPVVFDYDTTGAFEQWMADKLGLPALLVELRTHSSSEFSRHLPALQNSLKL